MLANHKPQKNKDLNSQNSHLFPSIFSAFEQTQLHPLEFSTVEQNKTQKNLIL
uniref:Uncharacterized protein n=1 Tax=Rhizophora mucronata TaxID=61149 RepID=A0A2P2QIC4_RHIMU